MFDSWRQGISGFVQLKGFTINTEEIFRIHKGFPLWKEVTLSVRNLRLFCKHPSMSLTECEKPAYLTEDCGKP